MLSDHLRKPSNAKTSKVTPSSRGRVSKGRPKGSRNLAKGPSRSYEPHQSIRFKVLTSEDLSEDSPSPENLDDSQSTNGSHTASSPGVSPKHSKQVSANDNAMHHQETSTPVPSTGQSIGTYGDITYCSRSRESPPFIPITPEVQWSVDQFGRPPPASHSFEANHMTEAGRPSQACAWDFLDDSSQYYLSFPAESADLPATFPNENSLMSPEYSCNDNTEVANTQPRHPFATPISATDLTTSNYDSLHSTHSQHPRSCDVTDQGFARGEDLARIKACQAQYLSLYCIASAQIEQVEAAMLAHY